MKKIKLCFFSAMLIMAFGVGMGKHVYAGSIAPLSLVDINTLPAVATDSNDNLQLLGVIWDWEIYQASWQKGITQLENPLITWGFG